MLFSDVVSGPTAGGPSGLGVPVTIYGTGFGASRGTSTVTIGGVEVAAYLGWGPGIAHNPGLEAVVVQPGPAVVGGPIVVTVDGRQSNADQTFSVNAARVLAIAPSGSDQADCSLASPRDHRRCRHHQDGAGRHGAGSGRDLRRVRGLDSRCPRTLGRARPTEGDQDLPRRAGGSGQRGAALHRRRQLHHRCGHRVPQRQVARHSRCRPARASGQPLRGQRLQRTDRLGGHRHPRRRPPRRRERVRRVGQHRGHAGPLLLRVLRVGGAASLQRGPGHAGLRHSRLRPATQRPPTSPG